MSAAISILFFSSEAPDCDHSCTLVLNETTSRKSCEPIDRCELVSNTSAAASDMCKIVCPGEELPNGLLASLLTAAFAIPVVAFLNFGVSTVYGTDAVATV